MELDPEVSSGGNGANTQAGLSLVMSTAAPFTGDRRHDGGDRMGENWALYPHVAILHWPADATIVAYSRAVGRPCLETSPPQFG